MELWIGWTENTRQYRLQVMKESFMAVYYIDSLVYLKVFTQLFKVAKVHFDNSLEQGQINEIKVYLMS